MAARPFKMTSLTCILLLLGSADLRGRDRQETPCRHGVVQVCWCGEGSPRGQVTLSQGFLEGHRRVSQVKSKERKDLPGQKNNKHESASLREGGLAWGSREDGVLERGGEVRWPL